jgi:ubiquinone/menaquinone biosynthesis C-methylase UbiE
LKRHEKKWRKFNSLLLGIIFYVPSGGERRFRNKCVNFINEVKAEQILDACCGTGVVANIIAGRVSNSGRIVGIDIDKSSLQKALIASQKGAAAFLAANSELLPFKAGSFNLCFISLGLHHMGHHARVNTLNEVFRTLEKTGILVIVEYNMPETIFARALVKQLVKLDRSREASSMLIDQNIIEEIKQAGFRIKRREFTHWGAIQLIEAVKHH